MLFYYLIFFLMFIAGFSNDDRDFDIGWQRRSVSDHRRRCEYIGVLPAADLQSFFRFQSAVSGIGEPRSSRDRSLSVLSKRRRAGHLPTRTHSQRYAYSIILGMHHMDVISNHMKTLVLPPSFVFDIFYSKIIILYNTRLKLSRYFPIRIKCDNTYRCIYNNII